MNAHMIHRIEGVWRLCVDSPCGRHALIRLCQSALRFGETNSAEFSRFPKPETVTRSGPSGFAPAGTLLQVVVRERLGPSCPRTTTWATWRHMAQVPPSA